MKCPSPAQWDLLAMQALEADEAERLYAHARTCPACRESWQAARRAHTDRVRMYETFDRDHDELREQLMAVLPAEPPRREDAGWAASAGRRLGGLAMSLNKSFGRRAVAVLVPAACLAVALLVFLSPKQDAFAAALKHMREAATITARFRMFMSDAEQPMMEGKLYLSTERGMRFDMHMGLAMFAPIAPTSPAVEPLAASMVMVRGVDGPLVMFNPELNFAMIMHGIDQLNEDARAASPDAFIRKFIEMTDQADRRLGRSIIEGREAEGFEVYGEKLGFKPGVNLIGMGVGVNQGPAAQPSESSVAARLWVDVTANLPVRMEIDLYIGMLGSRMLAVYDHFECDAPLEDSLFVLNIPEGTRKIEFTIPPVNEDTLIAGLRMFADYAGRYPTSLDPMSVSAQIGMAATMSGKIATNAADPLDNVLTGDFMNDVMKISIACTFMQKLVVSGQSPEYFGDIVTPHDAEEVLLKWRRPDGSYRIIYGDLRAETVTP